MYNKILQFIADNWFFIVIAIGVAIYTYEEIIKRSDEEKIVIAKHLIAVSIDALVAEAETKFADYEKSGQFKRSYVIQTIYEKYPVLNKVVEQELLLDWIGKLIEESVARLKAISSEIDKDN